MSNASHSLLEALKCEIPKSIEFDVSLANLSYWKVGGNALAVVRPRSIAELQGAIRIVNQHSTVPHMIIGDTSNLLFSDDGYDGVLIKIGNELSRIEFNENKAYCEAGVWVPELAYQTYRHALSGVEHICGIPGRIGGLVYMNGGSQRRGILENVESVQLVNQQGQLETVLEKDLSHAYRTSPFQGDARVIVATTLKLAFGERNEIRNEMRSILASRRKKFPRKLPNCGSVFLSNPSMYDIVGPPGLAIERAGLKGVRRGNAQISPLHANFIVNLGGASSADILYLIALARTTVYKQTGFLMDCEARYIDKNGDVAQAHVAADKLVL
jgi:UDP-N-acetylmuramate dehydrogenase